ncbi:MAG: YkvA family protein [Anaerolineae bacterium]
MSITLTRWRHWARQLKIELYALYLAYRDPRVPWYARLLAACVVSYAFSPIDLIPDPVPILGYLDDLVLIPAGVWLALKMIPPVVMAECREESKQVISQGKPVNWLAAGVIVLIWLGLAMLGVIWLMGVMS